MGIDKFLNSENEILKRISREIDEENNSDVKLSSHASHSSGHSSSGGHFSSTAKVEKPLKKNKK
tara:strand:+ start:1561 stop:1752 length:192 start_codon:yes stop_codon:yes gene_type:complete